jgi:thiamine biosynthesis lipoprotein
LIDCGEIGALGNKGADSPWSVGIQHPRQPDAFLGIARLANRCLSTSGDYATRFTDDYRYHHIFDPRTGRSPTELAGATIAAPTAMQADALSTAVTVLGVTDGLACLRSFPETDGLFVHKNGRTLTTGGFPWEA